MKMVIAVLFALVLISSASSYVQDNTNGTYGTSIVNGNCSKALDQDLVLNDHVHKLKIPFITRSATSTYYGDVTIYCLKAINQKEVKVGGHVNVTKGGVGHKFVNLEMKSFAGQGIDFMVSVYGK